MPVTINWNEENCFIVCAGSIIGEDIQEANYAFCLDARYRSAKYMIFDTTDVQRMDVSSIDIMGFAAADSAMSLVNSDIKVALVGTNTEITDKFKIYLDKINTFKVHWNTKVFSSTVEAVEWCEKS